MIVVDSNVIAYCWLPGPLTAIAQQVRLMDPEWHAPILWRSELRSILTGFLRDGTLGAEQVVAVMMQVERALEGREHLVPSDRVFDLAAATRLSAYDCEFIALAGVLSVPLVTEDKAVLRAFPDKALSMSAFIDQSA